MTGGKVCLSVQGKATLHLYPVCFTHRGFKTTLICLHAGMYLAVVLLSALHTYRQRQQQIVRRNPREAKQPKTLIIARPPLQLQPNTRRHTKHSSASQLDKSSDRHI
jgi:hypothetical protein